MGKRRSRATTEARLSAVGRAPTRTTSCVLLPGRTRALRDEYGDGDASWGHRSAVSTRKVGGRYGYRIHATVGTRTGLPVAWTLATAKENESALPRC